MFNTFTKLHAAWAAYRSKNALVWAGFALLTGLTGCASTKPLTASDCQTINWQAVGYQDAYNGYPQASFARHQQACATSGVLPNKSAWQQGYTQGLQQYCTPLRAYQLGREGIDYQDRCPPRQTLELLKAHDEGYLLYQRQRMLDELWYDRDPFWGYGWHGGFGILPPRHWR